MTIQVYEMGGYGVTASPNPTVYSNRAPVITDIISSAGNPYTVGQYWINQTTGNVYVYIGSGAWDQVGTPSGGPVDTLTGNTGGAVVPTAGNINIVGSHTTSVSGTGSTLTINATSAGYPITPFVVGPSGAAGYQTIQSALTAANTAGGGIVYVQPGTYTESLTLFGTTQVVGVPGNSDAGTTGNCVIISGVHTPPATGSFTFANVTLSSATHIFSSAVAGTAELILLNVITNLTSGFIFNLTNWTGNLITYNVGEESTNNGVVTNTAGATCFFISATHGAGTGQTMLTTGPVILQEIDLNCPWNATTGTTIACDYVIFSKTVTCANNSTGSFRNCTFSTGATAALTMSSSAAISLINSIISSSNNPSISGSGGGTLSIGDVTFTSNSVVANTLTVAYYTTALGTTDITGNLVFGVAGNKILSTSVASTTTAGANAFGTVTLVSGTATIATSAVTASSIIFLTRQSPGSTGASALGILSVGTIVAGTHFIINALTTANSTTNVTSDVSVVGWMIVN